MFFIGATNVPLNVLDPALTRAGRMGRQVQFRIPNKVDRADVLDFYMAKVAHTPDLDSEKRRDELARMTAGYSPAMIEQVCSIALMAAHHDGRAGFDRTDILTAMGTVESGTVVDFEYTPDELRQIAVHEAGHATVGHVYMGDTHEASRLTIRPRSDGSGGHWMAREKDDRFVHFRSEIFKDMLTTMAALAAEHVFYGENTSGVGGDMSSVAHQAAVMVGHCRDAARAHPDARDDDPQRGGGGAQEARRLPPRHGRQAARRGLARRPLRERPARARQARRWPRASSGTPISSPTSSPSRTRQPISRVADELVERRELNGDEITELHGLAAPEARRRRLPGGTHVATPVTGEAGPEGSPAALRNPLRRTRRTARRRRRGRRPHGHAHGRQARAVVDLGSAVDRRPRPPCARSPAHVQGTYLGPNGKELVTVRGGPLSVGSDPAVLVKPDATATGGYKFFDGASVEYQLCGNTTKGNCAIDQKKIAPNTSGALTRRMAYELALTTFHYVPEVQNVAVLLPAVIKGQKARMLVLSRGDTKDPKSLDAAIVPIREKDGQPNSGRGAQDRQRDRPADLPLRGHGDERQPARLPDHAAPDQGHRGRRRRIARRQEVQRLDGLADCRRVRSTALARLELIRIARIAAQVRERHAQRAVLHLPDVAQLVRDEIVVVQVRALAHQDDDVRRVAVEAAEPGQAEEVRRGEQPHAADAAPAAGRGRASRAGAWRARARGAAQRVIGSTAPGAAIRV